MLKFIGFCVVGIVGLVVIAAIIGGTNSDDVRTTTSRTTEERAAERTIRNSLAEENRHRRAYLSARLGHEDDLTRASLRFDAALRLADATGYGRDAANDLYAEAINVILVIHRYKNLRFEGDSVCYQRADRATDAALDAAIDALASLRDGIRTTLAGQSIDPALGVNVVVALTSAGNDLRAARASLLGC